MPDLAKLHFAGHARACRRGMPRGSRPSCAQLLRRAGARSSGSSAHWMRLPRAATARGSAQCAGDRARSARRSCSARRVWSRQHKFRIVIGPLSLRRLLRLLPGGASFHRLVPMGAQLRRRRADLGRAASSSQRDEVPPTRLGAGRPARRARLDHLARCHARQPADAADLYLDASADSHASHRSTQAAAAAPRRRPSHERNQSRRACSASSTASATRRSKARPCSASCAAIRMSSWCTGSIRSCRRRTPTCTASCGISSSTRRGWPPT